MSSSSFFVVAAVLVAMTGVSDAIQCFTCQDKTSNCVSGIMTSCAPTAQFCKLEWTAATDLTVQTCATSTDCPASNGISKRQAGRSFVGADGSTVGDISNCCNYDGCNCVGTQCDALPDSSVSTAATIPAIIAGILFALQL